MSFADLLAEMDGLRRESESLAARMRDAVTDEPMSGNDASGAVTIALRPDGAFLSVDILPDWRQRLNDASFGPAIVAACGAAVQEAVGRWVSNVAQPPSDKTPATEVVGDPVATEPAAVSEPAAAASFTAELLGLVREAEAGLDEFRRRAQEQAGTDRRLASADGRVTATVRGGELISVEIEPGWLAAADSDQLERALDAVLRSALPGVRHQLAQTLHSADPAARLLLDYTDDPASLLGRLGFGNTSR